MEFKDLVIDRRSIRRFLPDPVPDSDIREILATATHACNSGNGQHWQFVAIRNPDVKEQMVEILREKSQLLLAAVAKITGGERPTYAPQEFFLQAPVVLAVATARGKYRSRPDRLMLEAGHAEAEIDELRCRGDLQTMGAVIQLILLAAWEKGLGGCWMTGPLFARRELEALLGITGGDLLAALVPLGRPAVVPASRGRRAVTEVLRFV